MKKITILFLVLLNTNFLFSQVPSNDECSGAYDFGVLPAPGACGTGIQNGATKTIATTNVNSTPENPYLYLNGMANPANSVWYKFVCPSNGAACVISVVGATFANPNIALWKGACGNFSVAMGSVVGSGGTATLTSYGLTVGQLYYIQISGNTGQTGTFNLNVNALLDCSDCNNINSLTASPLPVGGTYAPGQSVTFCYHISKWSAINTSWLHGVQLSFGSGWNLSTLTTTPPLNAFAACGTWAYYPLGITSSANASVWPPGFYFDCDSPPTCANNGNPGNNFGDGAAGLGTSYTTTASQWNFYFTLQVKSTCNAGGNLSVMVNTSGDGESGNWSSISCSGDSPTNFSALVAGSGQSASNTGPYCEGDSIALSTLNVGTCVWSGPNGFSSTNHNPIIPNATTGMGGVYTVTVASTCTIISTTSVVVNTLPTISVNSGSICAGQSFTIMPSGANTYTYSGGSNVVNPISDTNYFVSGTDANGCVSSIDAVANVTVNALPTLVTTGANSVCIGSSNSIGVAGAMTYTWNTGQTTSSISVNPSVTTNYSVTGTDLNGCTNTHTITLMVDNTCADVWPGDANSDGIADNLDILELGLHYTQTGIPRASVSNAWQSYQADNWSGTITNGQNMNHGDCNGDGVINNDDTLAIFNNYGLTHAFKIAQTNSVNPQLSIIPDQNMVTKGNWGTASVYLGDATNVINSINGVAFSIDFDNTLIESNSIWMEYQNSFLDAGQNLHFRKLDFVNGKLYTASTHTVSNNVSGFGKIATLHYQIKSSLSTDDVLNIGLSQANLSDASGVINPLTSGTGTLMAIGASVGIKENLFSGNVLVSPNPTTGFINITSTNDLHLVEVTTVTGQVLLKKTCSDKTHQLQLNDFAEGVYFVKVSFANGSYVVKKIVKQ